MSKVALATLAGVGAGALGVVATIGALKWWKSRRSGSVRPTDMHIRPSRRERKLKLYLAQLSVPFFALRHGLASERTRRWRLRGI